MRNQARIAIMCLMAGWLAGGSAQAQLKVGDPAPKFTISEWVKGSAESLEDGRGEKIYVLDFWATWCMPCLQEIPKLTRMQEKYAGNNVVFIGVTGPVKGQQFAQVKQFVSSRSDAIGYTIGWDASDGMWNNYLSAVGANGIPYMFVIDKQGRVAWHGYPQPKLEQVIDALVAGTFDMAKEIELAGKQADLLNLQMQFDQMQRQRNWPGAVKVLEDIFAADPSNEMAVQLAYRIQFEQIKDATALRSWTESLIETYNGNPEALSAIAKVLMDIPDFGNRMPELMLQAARTAFEINGKDHGTAGLYARAAYSIGNLEEALRLQKIAVEMAPTEKKLEQSEILEYYESCLRLRDS